jgi:hypothetical protein
VSPSDEALDLSDDEKAKALEFDRRHDKSVKGGLPSGEAIRNIRPKERDCFLFTS